MCGATCGRKPRARCSMTLLRSAKNVMSMARRCSVLLRKGSSSPWRKRARCGSSPDAASADGTFGRRLFARVRTRLTLDVPPGLTDPNMMPVRGDHDADPVMRKIADVRPIRPAAVLIPIVDHSEPAVLLTQRAQHLPDHPGQVSFPGG